MITEIPRILDIDVRRDMSDSVYHRGYLNITSPLDLIDRFERFPLDKHFIDWLSNNGVRIRYLPWMEEGRANYYNTTGLITVSGKSSKEQQDFAIAHEFVHIASPNLNPIGIRPEYEEAIDEVARIHLVNSDFINYAKLKIPSACVIKRVHLLTL